MVAGEGSTAIENTRVIQSVGTALGEAGGGSGSDGCVYTDEYGLWGTFDPSCTWTLSGRL